MSLHLKKITLLLGSALFLTACQPNGPSIESLQKLRDVDSGIEITNSRIKSVSTVNETLALYDIEGMFKYRDGRYGYLTDIGGIKIYTPFNGEEATPFNANVIASNDHDSWDIVSENLPHFRGPNNNEEVFEHKMLFANSIEHTPGVYTHEDGSRFMLDNKALDKTVKTLIKEYEALLKQNVAVDETLSEMDLAMTKAAESIEKSVQKTVEKEQLEAEARAVREKELLTQALAEDADYQRIVAEHQKLEASLKDLHHKMPAFWNVPQCYETNYRFNGRICNQIAGINRDYLHKIQYENRPDADPQFLTKE